MFAYIKGKQWVKSVGMIINWKAVKEFQQLINIRICWKLIKTIYHLVEEGWVGFCFVFLNLHVQVDRNLQKKYPFFLSVD